MVLGFSAKSAVRDSDVKQLLRRVQRRSYSSYLLSMRLAKLRAYEDASIFFEFPVTALVGPNGGGKTTVLGAAAITSDEIKPKVFFAKSGTYDRSMVNWRVESEILEDGKPRKLSASYPSKKWDRTTTSRALRVFGVARTLPATERKDLTRFIGGAFKGVSEQALEAGTIAAVEDILGKEAATYLQVSAAEGLKQKIYAATTPDMQHYSEFHFGAGEASVIRIVNEIEAAPDDSLILIEEIENGLHPVAVRRLVEYLVGIALRKSCQVIFTTHSNDALAPLPDEAVWSCGAGVLRQGKLDVESLRTLTGAVEASLTVFVEDDFAKEQVLAALRSYARRVEMPLYGIDIHYVGGYQNVKKFTTSQNANPAVSVPAAGLFDGDQGQRADKTQNLYCLPGTAAPESHVYEAVSSRIGELAARLAVALSMPTTEQERLREVVPSVGRKNRDPHELFRELGDELEFMSASSVMNAFLGIWAETNHDEVDAICEPMRDLARPELVSGGPGD